MSEWFPFAGGSSWAPDPEHTAFVDPTRDLEALRRRWEVRSAQWRAAALAESIFGRPVAVRMRGGDPAGRGAFRGLLRLEVPFRDLDLQRWRERMFQACAARDPVLARVPLVYVFAPLVAGASPEPAP